MAETILEYTYAGDPTFAVNYNLGYIDRSHVQVRVNLAVDGAGDPVYANFVWLDASNITITDPLVNGDSITIIRTVPKDALAVEFEKGDDVTPANLDKQALQGLMTYEELLDGRVGESSPKLDADRAELARDEAEAANIAAQQAKDDAEAAETNAAASEGNAALSEVNAADSQVAAEAAETAAAGSASAADASDVSATAAASAASTYADDADASATAAAASQADVAIKYADFDTKYLGYKATDPVLDNQGAALVHGQLYYNTTDDELRAYVKNHVTEPDGWYWIGTDPALSVAATSVVFDPSGNSTAITDVQILLAAILDGTAFDGGAIAPEKLDRVYAVPADIPYFAEFHDATRVGSWRIVGTTLECWGKRGGAANPTVTFPKTFAASPVVTTTAEGGGSSTVVAHAAPTVSGFGAAVRTVNADNYGNSTNQFYWHAIGEWDGIS